MYGGVRGRKTRVGEKLHRFPPTRLYKFMLQFSLFLGIVHLTKKQYLCTRFCSVLVNSEYKVSDYLVIS